MHTVPPGNSSADASGTALVHAASYLKRGFQPLPIAPGTKKPTIDVGWPSLRLSESQLPDYFSNGTGVGVILGKASSGLTDVEIAELTQHFFKRAVRQHGRYFEVEPDTVLEIAFDKIQQSDRHNSGLAMRFPRIVRIRTDKPVSEIDTLATARKLVAR